MDNDHIDLLKVREWRNIHYAIYQRANEDYVRYSEINIGLKNKLLNNNNKLTKLGDTHESA